MNNINVRKAIKAYRDKNNLSFGYKILNNDISNESEFISAITFLNTDGSDMETNPITWSNVETEKPSKQDGFHRNNLNKSYC